MLDLKITGGTVVDGSGKKAFRADVGITKDKIVSIGDLSAADARKTIDAAGMTVAPGFIDMHTHSDFSILYDPLASSRIYNGVTTDVVGNCGIGAAPVCEGTKELLIKYLTTRIAGSVPVEHLDLPWETYAEYLDYVDQKPAAINVVPLVAQGAIRIHEMGFDNLPPTREQMERMKDEVRKAMEAGACGLTSGLVYLPGLYTGEEELAELCTAIRPYGVKYITHQRDEGFHIYESMEEAIRISRKAGVGLHISHLKLAHTKQWGESGKVLARIREEREKGLDLTYDTYPYTNGMTSLAYLIPSWCFEGEGVAHMLALLKDPEQRKVIEEEVQKKLLAMGFSTQEEAASNQWIANVTADSGKWMESKSLLELAESQGKTIAATVCDILLEQESKVQMRGRCMDENDMETFTANPESMVGSDSMCMSNKGIMAGGKTHPRAYGTQGTILRYFVREKGLLTLEDAVRKMTSLPAETLRLDRRGLLAEGYFADVVVFDADSVRDNATYNDPKIYTSGVSCVIVNGQLAMENGEQNDAVLAGRLLRRKA